MGGCVHGIVAQVVSLAQAARLRTNDQTCFHAPVTRKLTGRDRQPRVMEEAPYDEARGPAILRMHCLAERIGHAHSLVAPSPRPTPQHPPWHVPFPCPLHVWAPCARRGGTPGKAKRESWKTFMDT